MWKLIMAADQLRRFVRDEKGLTAIEYGVFAAFVVLALVGAAIAVGPQLQTWIETRIDCIVSGTALC